MEPNGNHNKSWFNIESEVPVTVQEKLFTLLDDNPTGILLTDLDKLFKLKFGNNINFLEYETYNASAFVNALPNVFRQVLLKNGKVVLFNSQTPVNSDEEKLRKSSETVDSVKNKVTAMLKNAAGANNYGGIECFNFLEEYKTTYGNEFNLELFKSANIEDFFKYNDGLMFKIKQYRNIKVICPIDCETNEKTDFYLFHLQKMDRSKFPSDCVSPHEKLQVLDLKSELQIGSKVLVHFREIISNTDFYFTLLKYKVEFGNELDEMNKFYESLKDNKYALPDWVAVSGMFCVVKDHKSKNAFKRAQITKAVSWTHVECFCVDYGGYLTVPISNLFYLHNDFSKLPWQAIHGQLKNSSESLTWNWEATMRFIAIIKNKEKEVKIVDIVGGIVSVEIFIKKKNILDILENEGYFSEWSPHFKVTSDLDVESNTSDVETEGPPIPAIDFPSSSTPEESWQDIFKKAAELSAAQPSSQPPSNIPSVHHPLPPPPSNLPNPLTFPSLIPSFNIISNTPPPGFPPLPSVGATPANDGGSLHNQPVTVSQSFSSSSPSVANGNSPRLTPPEPNSTLPPCKSSVSTPSPLASRTPSPAAASISPTGSPGPNINHFTPDNSLPTSALTGGQITLPQYPVPYSFRSPSPPPPPFFHGFPYPYPPHGIYPWMSSNYNPMPPFGQPFNPYGSYPLANGFPPLVPPFYPSANVYAPPGFPRLPPPFPYYNSMPYYNNNNKRNEQQPVIVEELVRTNTLAGNAEAKDVDSNSIKCEVEESEPVPFPVLTDTFGTNPPTLRCEDSVADPNENGELINSLESKSLVKKIQDLFCESNEKNKNAEIIESDWKPLHPVKATPPRQGIKKSLEEENNVEQNHGDFNNCDNKVLQLSNVSMKPIVFDSRTIHLVTFNDVNYLIVEELMLTFTKFTVYGTLKEFSNGKGGFKDVVISRSDNPFLYREFSRNKIGNYEPKEKKDFHFLQVKEFGRFLYVSGEPRRETLQKCKEFVRLNEAWGDLLKI